jgi:hypothetical protein
MSWCWVLVWVLNEISGLAVERVKGRPDTLVHLSKCTSETRQLPTRQLQVQGPTPGRHPHLTDPGDLSLVFPLRHSRNLINSDRSNRDIGHACWRTATAWT